MIGLMVMARGSLEAVPLPTLFPRLLATEMESLRCSALLVDAARADDAELTWLWEPSRSVFPGAGPGAAVILLAEITEQAERGDQLQFLLDVAWTEQAELSASAAVNVACWCDTDHATHDVDALHLIINSEASLGQALRAGVGRLVGRLADPRDADYWRLRAGVPAR